MLYSTFRKLVKENSKGKIHINSAAIGYGLVTVIEEGSIVYFNMTFRGNIGSSKSEVLEKLKRISKC